MSTPRVLLQFGITPEYRFVLQEPFELEGEDYGLQSPDLLVEFRGQDAMNQESWQCVDEIQEVDLLRSAVVLQAEQISRGSKSEAAALVDLTERLTRINVAVTAESNEVKAPSGSPEERVLWMRKEIELLRKIVQDQRSAIERQPSPLLLDRQTLADRIANLRVELDAANEARGEAETKIEILQRELDKLRKEIELLRGVVKEQQSQPERAGRL